MTKRFLAMFPYLWEVEGTSYENDKDDPGGETRWGIDKRSHPHEDIKHLSEARAKEIYWKEYWQRNSCGSLPHPLGEAFFDTCVNAGRGRADKLLAITRDAAKFIDEKDAFYRRLAAKRPASKKYLRGWLNRNNLLRKQLHLPQRRVANI